MTLKIKAISAILTIYFTLLVSINSSNAIELHFITEELPPNNYTENGQIKGISVDLLKEIWKRNGKPAQPIKVLPWSQGYDLILNKPGTVLFSMARLGTRENVFKWAGPVVSMRFVLFAKKGKIKPESLRNMKQFRFGAIVNEAGEFLLLEQGVPTQNIDRSATNAKMVKKLANGKIDMIAFSELATQELFDKKGLDPRQFEAVGTLSGSSLWYAFHKDIPNDVVELYQKTLDAIKADGTYDKIANKYLKKK
jgi:polar amino acid transport system substrate-binding protein